jgi:hypothetical protein
MVQGFAVILGSSDLRRVWERSFCGAAEAGYRTVDAFAGQNGYFMH